MKTATQQNKIKEKSIKLSRKKQKTKKNGKTFYELKRK